MRQAGEHNVSTTPNEPVAAPSETTAAPLLAAAKEQGEPDGYVGKRESARFSLGAPLDVTTSPGDEAGNWRVVMHNISATGVSFWSKREVAADQPIYFRHWSGTRPGPWISGRVVHCTLGVQGYLTGVQLDHPIPETNEADDATGNRSETTATGAVARPKFSLRTACAVAPTLAGAVAFFASALVSYRVWPEYTGVWLPALCISLGTASLIAWLLLRRYLRFIDPLVLAIRRTATRSPAETPLNDGGFREIADMQAALVELATTWKKRDDAGRLQRQRLEQINQLKSNILCIVSHDLRTPLTSILLYAQMLAEEIDDLSNDDRKRFLDIITNECTRLARLVDDLLEVQRLEAGRSQWDMQPRDLSKTISDCAALFEPMAESKSIKLTVQCPKTLPPVEADSDKISQVLSNLLSNAVKYTPVGGEVKLTARAQAREILLRVTDTGPGISRDKWDQIFNRFTQLANPMVREMAGVGLGLYIVRQLVERHGGAVWVDSEPGRGSDFFVSIPIQHQPESAGGDPNVGARGRALVCDADPELAATIARMLRQSGFEVATAHSGCRLLAQLEAFGADVVVTDLLLPDMNASRLLDALHAGDDRTYRLIVHSYAGDAGELQRRGVDIFLRRPATKDELIQAVEVAVQRNTQGGLTALVITGPDLDARPLSNQLSAAGHLPLVVGSVDEARRLVADYAIDVVLIAENALVADWSNLTMIGVPADREARIFVLCQYVGRREQRAAAAAGAETLTYEIGREPAIVSAIARTAELAFVE